MFTDIFHEAVQAFWGQRKAQRQHQELTRKVDQGNRSDVTYGKQMDGFLLVIRDLLLNKGVPASCIYIEKSLTTIPGFFRPTKSYDLLVVVDGYLKAARIE